MRRFPNVPVESMRLYIEPIAAKHAELLFEALQDPAIYQWISSEPPADFLKLRDWYSKLSVTDPADQAMIYLHWAVRRKDDGVWVGKMDADIDSTNVATNIGYLFFPPFWGNGYATEAVTALSNHLMKRGIVEQRAAVTLGNSASYRVLERSGFSRSRIIPQNDTIRGKVFDDVEFVRR